MGVVLVGAEKQGRVDDENCDHCQKRSNRWADADTWWADQNCPHVVGDPGDIDVVPAMDRAVGYVGL